MREREKERPLNNTQKKKKKVKKKKKQEIIVNDKIWSINFGFFVVTTMIHYGGGAQNERGGPSEAGGGGGYEGEAMIMPRKKGPWTSMEDEILAEYVRTHGEGNWNAVQKNTGLARCGKSCRLRWANHLRPNLKKGAFTPEEERIIVELHAKHGNRWARMASELPGRTDNEIKNYWNTRVKRRQRLGLPLYPPDVHPTYQTQQQLPSYQSQQSSSSYQSQQQSSYQSQQQQQHLSHSTPPLSPISTPTTPCSSFTFQTPLLHHSPSPVPSPTTPNPPPPLSPTTPPPLSPSLSSPHQFPTLPLFSTSISNNSTTPTNDNNNQSPFSFPRAPPLLQTPQRFKRFNHVTALANHDNTNGNYNNNTNLHSPSTMTSNGGGFVLPFSPSLNGSFTSLLTRPNSCPTTPTFSSSDTNRATQIPLLVPSHIASFSMNPLTFDPGSPHTLQAHFDSSSGQQQMLSPTGSVYSVKPELPSSQFSSQNSYSVMSFDTKLKRSDNRNKRNLGSHRYSSGYLEDLLEEAKVMAGGSSGWSLKRKQVMGLLEEKPALPGGFDQWGPSSNASLSPELKPKGAVEMNTMHEDLTKLLNDIPSTMGVPEWYMDNGEVSNGQSSVVTDDNLGLDMQIASLFPVDPVTDQGTNPNTCSWDNLPGIC